MASLIDLLYIFLQRRSHRIIGRTSHNLPGRRLLMLLHTSLQCIPGMLSTPRTLNVDQLEAMESIDTCPSAPWQEPPFTRICADTDPRTAAEEVSKVMRDPTTAIYTDASANNGNLGAAVVMLDTNDTVYRARQIVVGPFGKRVKRADSDRCECGAVEIVVHVFIDCPKLRELRCQLRKVIGDRFNNLATMLGGRRENIGEKQDHCRRTYCSIRLCRPIWEIQK